MKLLHIDSSILGDNSASRQLSQSVVKAWQAAEPSSVVTYRDLAADAISHFSSLTLAAGGTAAELHDAAQRHEAELSASTLEEFLAADAIVIAAPMYNFSVPTSLRAWFDYVLRAGETFSYSEAGPKGLLGGKRVIVIESRGGLYSEGPAKVIDFQEPYLRHLLGFVGLTDVTFVHAEKIGYGPDARSAALTQAKARIAVLAQPALASAA